MWFEVGVGYDGLGRGVVVHTYDGVGGVGEVGESKDSGVGDGGGSNHKTYRTPGGSGGSVKRPTPIRGKATTLGQISSGSRAVSSRARRSRMLVSTLRGIGIEQPIKSVGRCRHDSFTFKVGSIDECQDRLLLIDACQDRFFSYRKRSCAYAP